MNYNFKFNLSLFRSSFAINFPYFFMTLVVFLLAYHSTYAIYLNFNNQQITEGPFTEASHEMFNFIIDHTDNTDVIVFFKPRVLALLTGRKSIMVSDIKQLKKKVCDYLVIRKSRGINDPIAPHYDQISPYGEEFSRLTRELLTVFENADFIIFQLKRLGD
jgi:hypothetical protein